MLFSENDTPAPEVQHPRPGALRMSSDERSKPLIFLTSKPWIELPPYKEAPNLGPHGIEILPAGNMGEGEMPRILSQEAALALDGAPGGDNTLQGCFPPEAELPHSTPGQGGGKAACSLGAIDSHCSHQDLVRC